jgi:hypothetical protein
MQDLNTGGLLEALQLLAALNASNAKNGTWANHEPSLKKAADEVTRLLCAYSGASAEPAKQ